MFIFDLPGPQFIALYIVLMVAGIVWASKTQKLATAAGKSDIPEPDDVSYDELAFLADGPAGLAQAVLAKLVQAGALTIVDDKVTAKSGAALDISSFERKVVSAVAARPHSRADFLKLVASSTAALEDRAIRAGWMQEPTSRQKFTPSFPLFLIVLIGIVKIIVGISRDKPVTILVILTIITFFVACAWTSAPKVTRRGRDMIARWREKNTGLRETIKADPSVLNATDVGLGIALFGLAAVPIAAGTDVRKFFGPQATSTSSGVDGASTSGSTSCSGSSDSGGSSDGGGSCGGGGGCGGCGGGGGD